MKKLILIAGFALLAGTVTESFAYRTYRTEERVVHQDECCSPITGLFDAVGSLVAIPFNLFNTCCDSL